MKPNINLNNIINHGHEYQIMVGLNKRHKDKGIVDRTNAIQKDINKIEKQLKFYGFPDISKISKHCDSLLLLTYAQSLEILSTRMENGEVSTGDLIAIITLIKRISKR